MLETELYSWLQDGEKDRAMFLLVVQDVKTGVHYPIYLNPGKEFPVLRAGEQTFVEIFDICKWKSTRGSTENLPL